MKHPPNYASLRGAAGLLKRKYRNTMNPSREELQAELNHVRNLIQNFVTEHSWAAESWKNQDHIKPLFDYAQSCEVDTHCPFCGEAPQTEKERRYLEEHGDTVPT